MRRMYKPSGLDLLATLIDLYAEQENVKITCKVERKYIDENE